MHRKLLASSVVVASGVMVAVAFAQVPLQPAGSPTAAPSGSAARSAAPAPQASAGRAPAVPTYWVLMVTGERDGLPWIKTSTPETLGGSVKGTGPWTCTYPPTERGGSEGVAYEQMEVGCAVGEAEVFVSLRCNYRTKAKPGKVAGKGWKRSDLQTLNLRRKGDAKSTLTVSLRCDVDAAFATD
jgi:hypothetical protein